MSSGALTPNAAGRPGRIPRPAPTRCEILALAGVLTGTLLTMAAAVAGLTRKPTPLPAIVPTVSQIVQVPPTTTPRIEPGD